MDKELTYILQKIGLLREKFDLHRNKEEKFNIFSVLYKEHEERRLHSRFIAALLDPFASHEMKDLFLKSFLSLFKEINLNDFQDAIVYPEEWNKKENNNIDILIIDKKSSNAIIIENKIYAGDSNNESGGQLERYYKHIRDNEKIPEKNIIVFYLTLDGHHPTNDSLGSFKTLERINCQCISYESHILRWLKMCNKNVYNKPFLRESVLQYEKLINKMTNNETDIEERIKMKDTIAQNVETMMATKYLIDNFKHVKWHTVSDFWNELKHELEDKGFSDIKPIETESITHLTHYSYNKKEEDGGIIFKISEELEGFVWHEKDEWLFWGFEKDGVNVSLKKEMDNLSKEGCLNDCKSNWWNYFEFSDNEKLWLKDFSKEKTFNLIDPTFRKETVRKIVEDISDFITSKIKYKSN